MKNPAIGTVLVTGGAGYIGSHTCVELIRGGYRVVVVDNLSTSSQRSLDRVEQITGTGIRFHHADIRNEPALDRIFDEEDIDAVIHFAAMKAVGESTEIPLEYFHTNVGGTASVMKVMKDHDVNTLVFSSSCSVYGDTLAHVLDEQSPTAPTNPYAWTKLACEQMVSQACLFGSRLHAISLRYFNPIGAHPSGLLGEDPRVEPRNIMPHLVRAALGRAPHLRVFGDDYPTPDGTAIRDYIHVSDVAAAHVDALSHIPEGDRMEVYNLGTGQGTSVLELRDAFAKASGREIPVSVEPRRLGDVPRLVAGPAKVQREWGWSASRSLDDMCLDAWRFQEFNPRGYEEAPVHSAAGPLIDDAVRQGEGNGNGQRRAR